MNAAFNAVTVAETALETATNAQVQLSDQSFQFLQAGECGWIVIDSSYQTAHVTYTTAVTTLATARTTYTLSVTAHTEAVTEAARLKLECEFATQSAHAAAWATANADNDANDAAWAQAHHIDCVIEHISEAHCAFGPTPGLTQPALCIDIESCSFSGSQYNPATDTCGSGTHISQLTKADLGHGYWAYANAGGHKLIPIEEGGSAGSTVSSGSSLATILGACTDKDNCRAIATDERQTSWMKTSECMSPCFRTYGNWYMAFNDKSPGPFNPDRPTPMRPADVPLK